MWRRLKSGAYIASAESINIGIFEACIIGLVAAAGAVALKDGVGLVGTWRVHQATALGPWILPVVGCIGGVLSGLVVRYVSPETGGSGIAQTKAALSGTDLPLTMKTGLMKLVGCVVSLGSGLALGREGPTVQVAAGIASKFTGFVRTTPAHRNQLIAAGAGAGLAAAFNAPLAGALFVLEVLLKRMSGLAVGTTVVACFVAAVVSRLVGVQSLDIDFNDLAPKATFAYYDIPFYIVMGIIAGVLGAMFNKTQMLGLKLVRDVIKLPLPIACGLAGLATGLILMHLPSFYRDYAGLREILVRGEAGLIVTLVAFVLQFVLTSIAFSTRAPGGIFAPSLTLGACLGHLVSASQQFFIGTTHPASFAIVGMGAAFCAIARSPMTAVVIIFEMTMDFNVVLPLMVCSVLAYVVAEILDPTSIYDQILRWQGIRIMEYEPEHGILGRLKATDVMHTEVETISDTTPLKELRILFASNPQGDYPVLDKNGELVGIVSTTDMEKARKRHIADEAPARRIMTAKPITVKPDERLSVILMTMDRLRMRYLPVVDRRRMVGIINQEDILSAESKALGMKRKATTSSYVVYQTRAPEAGRGTLLVAVADPRSAKSLLRIASRIAKKKNFELECLNVILIPKDKDPSEARVSPQIGRQIADEAEAVGDEFNIPVHTNIRVSHDIGDAICETIEERQSNLFLMRWTGSRRAQKGKDLITSVLRNTNCPVILLTRVDEEDLKDNYRLPVAKFLDHELGHEIGNLMFSGNVEDGESNVKLINVTANGEGVPTDQFIGPLTERAAREKEFSVEVRDLEAKSSTRVLLMLEGEGDSDGQATVFGMKRKNLLKMMNKSSFKKTLNSKVTYPVILVCGEEQQ